MDSLTQFVLGAAVGHIVLGRHMYPAKAMLLGGLAGTIPDLDIFPLAFADMVTALDLHRGLSHSLLFSLLAPFGLGWISHRKKPTITRIRWYWFWFFCFLTHIMIDACTTWGTQLFWPFSYRVSLHSVFIIDPAYTVPLLLSLLTALWLYKKSGNNNAIRATKIGLYVSSAYLLFGFGAKYYVGLQFENAFREQNISVRRYMTRPTPFNGILWALTAETEAGFFSGYRSIFDKGPIVFSPIEPKNHTLLTGYSSKKLTTLLRITDGYYRVETVPCDTLALPASPSPPLPPSRKQLHCFAIYDLRFGKFGAWAGAGNDIFVYHVSLSDDRFAQAPRHIENPKQLFSSLWHRLWGNAEIKIPPSSYAAPTADTPLNKGGKGL